MILYHGSNVEVREPKLSLSRNNLDFGSGFYLTSDREQAEKWAIRVTKIRGTGKPVISTFETLESAWNGLNILSFESANKAWLETVVKYRTGQEPAEIYDVITGPIANDRTVDVINQYISGTFPEEIALQLLLPMKLKDQWTVKTEKAVNAVEFKGAIDL